MATDTRISAALTQPFGQRDNVTFEHNIVPLGLAQISGDFMAAPHG